MTGPSGPVALSHSLLGSLLQEDGATWFNPDAFTRQWVEQGWALDEANAQAWQEACGGCAVQWTRATTMSSKPRWGAQTIPRLLLDACAQHRVAMWFCGLSSVELHLQRVAGGRR